VNIGVVSFSEMGDQLSQWRGYCQIGKGYSLGFSGLKLQTLAKQAGYFLLSCVYDRTEQIQLIRELIAFGRFYKTIEEKTTILTPLAQFEFNYAALLTAAIIKSIAFGEEKEWRLISTILSYSDANFRSGKNSLKPYWHFDLGEKELFSLIKQIIIGPTPEHELAKMAIEGYANKMGMQFRYDSHKKDYIPDAVITNSNIPYREI
jgi:hypothetical protein